MVFAVSVPIPVPAHRMAHQRAYRQGWEDRPSLLYGAPEETPSGWQSWLRETKTGLARALSMFPGSRRDAGRADPQGLDDLSSLPDGLAEKDPPEEDTSAGWRAWLRKAQSYLPRLSDLFPARSPALGEASPVPSRKEHHPWNPVTMKVSSPQSRAASAR